MARSPSIFSHACQRVAGQGSGAFPNPVRYAPNIFLISSNIRPLMYKLVKQDEFIPETMSTSYVARRIFDEVRKEFPDYIIKFSSDSPRNPKNRAGKAELKIIEMFNNNPRLKRWKGIITINGKPYMSKFSARRMQPSCLRCHGDPADAPASLLERYGSKAGFHRPVGKVIGLDTVAVPMDKINKKLWAESIKNIFISGMGILLLFTGIALAFKFLITDRLRNITRHFEQVAEQTHYDEMEPIEIEGKDEINALASSFNSLSEKLKRSYASMDRKVKHRTIELEKANEKLLQEIIERRETEQALRESEEKYRKVLSSNPDPVVVYDNDGKVIFFNAAFTRVFGWHLEECLNQKMDVFVPDENWHETRMMIEKAKAGKDYQRRGKNCRHRKKFALFCPRPARGTHPGAHQGYPFRYPGSHGKKNHQRGYQTVRGCSRRSAQYQSSQQRNPAGFFKCYQQCTLCAESLHL
jgi:PAS domain S-box-containing protein